MTKNNIEKQIEELEHKIKGQECVIETQKHNEEVYEELVKKLEKELNDLKRDFDDVDHECDRYGNRKKKIRGGWKMIEKVNPEHPDKIADRIAGAIVDLGYKLQENPKIAVEVLIGHGNCRIIIESSVNYSKTDLFNIVYRITKINNIAIEVILAKQDKYLASNQKGKIRCGDNGIFKGVPLTEEQTQLSYVAHQMYDTYKSDGKYILDKDKLIICQSKAGNELKGLYPTAIINPLGYWTGGINVDTGATNRKLGSDMADSLTGGGLHGKDLSKADVSLNIYVFLKAQEIREPVEISCAIGDEIVDGKPYEEIVEIARKYINSIGGFEKFAEWGLF